VRGIDLDGRVGEAWSGDAPNGSHINVVIGRRGSPTAAAIVGALTAPRPGHVPFLACLELGAAIRPRTIVVNKSTIDGDLHGRITWGAAQLGIAQGVMDAVAEGLIDPAEADDVVLLVPVWVDPAAEDETAVRTANRVATRDAIADAVSPASADEIRALADRREDAHNAYYSGD
jgi:5,6,7,8-tetrahydromethanopterin hydro-lyase